MMFRLVLLAVLLLLVSNVEAKRPGGGKPPPTQTIASITTPPPGSSCSFTSGTTNDPVCTLAVTMSPASPSFSGTLALCTGTNAPVTGCSGANTGGFHLAGSVIEQSTGGSGTAAGVYSDVTAYAAQGSLTTIFQPLTLTGTAPGSQTIASIVLDNTATTTGLSSGTLVGTLSVALSAPTPTFDYTGTNLHLSTSGADSGGVCNGTNGAANGSFQITSAGILETNGSPTAGSKLICVAGAAAGVTASGQAFTITVGHLIVASTLCAAHGGGDGSSGSPWQAACIQAAFDAAVDGDTVFLASGNWALSTGSLPALTAKAINLVGAGSSNTFNELGQPNNASGALVTATTSNNITRIYTTGTVFTGGAGTGGYIGFHGTGSFGSPDCNHISVSHLLVDGSSSTDGGGPNGTLNFLECSDIDIDDIRVIAFAGPQSAEGQFWMGDTNNITIENGVFADHYTTSSFYWSSVVAETVIGNHVTVTNSSFYQNGFSAIDMDNVVYNGNVSYESTDGLGTTGVKPGFAVPGCGIGPGAGCQNGGTNGSYHLTANNNYFDATGLYFGLGGGLNDPGTGGGLNDLSFVGNTIVSGYSAIDSCVWHYYNLIPGDNINCLSTVAVTAASWSSTTVTFVVADTPAMHTLISSGPGTFGTIGFSPIGYNTATVPNPPFHLWAAATDVCAGGNCTITATCGGGNPACPASSPAGTLGRLVRTDTGNPDGMQINGTVNSDCTEAATPSAAFTSTNNSIIGTNTASLNASGTGAMGCRLANNDLVLHDNTVVNFNASQNYLSATNKFYVTSVGTVNDSVSNNYGLDVSSGFTTPPTCSFTLGRLSGSNVPFTNASFTAQYGAVQWLASILSTAPTSGGQAGGNSWRALPPVSLSASHGSTVYMWVMDSVNNISPSCSALVP